MKRDMGLICGLGGINVTECEEKEGKVEKRERRRGLKSSGGQVKPGCMEWYWQEEGPARTSD